MSKINNQTKKLISVLVLLPIISIFSQNFKFFDFLNNEIGVFEFIQNIFLLLSLYLLIKNFNKLKLISNLKYLFLKISILSFLIFEEFSFITRDTIDFTKNYNIQNEFNIHNLDLFTKSVLNNIPIVGSVSLMPLLVICVLTLFGFGSYLPISSNAKILFLDKKYSFYTQIFLINLFLTRILFLPYDIFVIEPELVELFLYLIFLLDTKHKCSQARKFKMK